MDLVCQAIEPTDLVYEPTDLVSIYPTTSLIERVYSFSGGETTMK